MSTKPGVTIKPSASISRSPRSSRRGPTAVIRLPVTATSPCWPGLPVPSMIVALRMTRSVMAVNHPRQGRRRATARHTDVKAMVIYESLTGNTRKAAALIGEQLDRGGLEVVALSPTTAVDLQALSAVDLVVVGTWTDGIFVVGQRP